jgi:hypothetical protein
MEEIKSKIQNKLEIRKTINDLIETIFTILESTRYELIDEEQLMKLIREHAEQITKSECNKCKTGQDYIETIHEDNGIEIQRTRKSRVITCNIENEKINVMFTVNFLDIITPSKKLTMLLNVKEVRIYR